MTWKTLIIYYLGATLTFLMYFAVALWTGLVFDEKGHLQKKKLMVHVFVFLISFSAATLLVIRDMEIEAKSKFVGKLDSGTRIIMPTEKPKVTKLEIGWTLNRHGSTFVYSGGKFSDAFGPKGVPVTKVFEDIALVIGDKDGQIKISITIRDETGAAIAKLIENEWQVAPPPKTLDRNYTKNMLEVIGEKDEVLLQVRALKDRIQLNGVFYASNGCGVEIFPPDESDRGVKFPSGTKVGVMHFLGPDTPRNMKLKPIFRYPSELHLHELR